ncbi:uncharacterized protein [Physcomitrium patens]|uniref:uncharacterized protein n=1 Tax=Physcomitrium patens TaxID=3218 RepID=UPI003CCDBC69
MNPTRHDGETGPLAERRSQGSFLGDCTFSWNSLSAFSPLYPTRRSSRGKREFLGKVQFRVYWRFRGTVNAGHFWLMPESILEMRCLEVACSLQKANLIIWSFEAAPILFPFD